MADDAAVKRFREAVNAMVDAACSCDLLNGYQCGTHSEISAFTEAAIALVHVPGCLCNEPVVDGSGQVHTPGDKDCIDLREELRRKG